LRSTFLGGFSKIKIATYLILNKGGCLFINSAVWVSIRPWSFYNFGPNVARNPTRLNLQLWGDLDKNFI